MNPFLHYKNDSCRQVRAATFFSICGNSSVVKKSPCNQGWLSAAELRYTARGSGGRG